MLSWLLAFCILFNTCYLRLSWQQRLQFGNWKLCSRRLQVQAQQMLQKIHLSRFNTFYEETIWEMSHEISCTIDYDLLNDLHCLARNELKTNLWFSLQNDKLMNLYEGGISGKNGSLVIVGNQDHEPVPLDTVANFVCNKRTVYHQQQHGVEPTTSVPVIIHLDNIIIFIWKVRLLNKV